jgi:glycosyltransferase involved in cell wall biosynthesis
MPGKAPADMLVVAPHPFFTPRGTPFSVYYRTLVMAEAGVRIDLLTYGTGQDVDIPGCRIVRIPRIRALEPIPVGPSGKKALLDVLMVLWTVGLLLRHRYRLVHAHEEAVFWLRALKPLLRFRMIYDMHSSLPQQLGNFGFTDSRLIVGTFKWLEDSCLKAADAVITICPDLRDYALAQGVPEDRHFLIENSIFEDVRLAAPPASASGGGAAPVTGPATETDTEPATETGAQEETGSAIPPHDGPTLVYAGTFEKYQGIDRVVRAFAAVSRERPDARLILAGGTDAQVAAMRKVAEEAGLGEACVFTGRVPKAVALRLNREADVLLSPRIDGTNTPLKIYEQLASGKPLIATDIWSHTQVLDEEVCFLVEPTPESIANGMLRVLDDPEEARRRAANARALFERDYARPIYERKIAALLERVGFSRRPAEG